jgi:hypothetical protein
MSEWKSKLNADPLPWLLEPDGANPGVRYFVLRDLLDRPASDPELLAAQADVMHSGPVPTIGSWNTVTKVNCGPKLKRKENPASGLTLRVLRVLNAIGA